MSQLLSCILHWFRAFLRSRHDLCFFIIRHERRRILPIKTTEHPTSPWVVQQRREVFPEETAAKYLILDRDTKFGGDVPEMLNSLGRRLIRTAYRSPGQNGVAERCWAESWRRELLDHGIVFNETHLRRLLREYIHYYHEDRTHEGLGKDRPDSRPVERRIGPKTESIALPRLGGLHRRYKWAA